MNMKKIKVLKLKKKKKVLRKKKKYALEELKQGAQFSLNTGQKYVYVRMVLENCTLKNAYNSGFAYGIRLNPSNPKKNALSVLRLAMIRKYYGLKEFKKFVKEMRQDIIEPCASNA